MDKTKLLRSNPNNSNGLGPVLLYAMRYCKYRPTPVVYVTYYLSYYTKDDYIYYILL
jgi:hypothetical protein